MTSVIQLVVDLLLAICVFLGAIYCEVHCTHEVLAPRLFIALLIGLFSLWGRGIFVSIAFIAVGLLGELLQIAPAGASLVGTSLAGLAVVHLMRLEGLSLIWAGLLRVSAALTIWAVSVEAAHGMQSGVVISTEQIGLIGVQWGIAAVIWAGGIILFQGIKNAAR